jgi:DNA-binding transcriptional LysR family regulator
MELRDLRYFAVVAEHQNIGRAAEALNLSATALGKSLRRLEKSVGAKLAQRASKGIALTAVGTALLRRIGPLQGMLNDVRHEAADLAQGRAGHINVGVSPGAPENSMADACVSLSKESGSITLTISAADTSVLSKWLRRGEIDFCVAGPRLYSSAEFVREHLYDDPFVVFASANHRLARRKRLSIADLEGERWVSLSNPQRQTAFRIFGANGVPLPVIALDTSSPAVRLSAVAYSDYLGLISRQLLRQECRRYPLVELPVKEFTLASSMSIIYRTGAYLSPAARRLIAMLKAQAR